MDSKIELDANSQSGKNLITKQVREGKIKYYFLKKIGKRLTIQRYLANQNIQPSIIVFHNFWPTIVRKFSILVIYGKKRRNSIL